MSTEISDLPPELVRYILTFVESRNEAALVCKDFYENVCSIEKNNFKLTLNQHANNSEKDATFMENLMMSKRQISEIWLSESHCPVTEKLDPIFKKFGGNVKKFVVYYCGVKEKELGRWLNMMPLLEEIDFDHMRIYQQATRSIPTLNLSKLKKVTFKECLVGTQMYIIRAFPTGVVKELSWNNRFQRTKATSFLENQPNIKTLVLHDDSLADESSLNILDLKELTIRNDFDPPYKMFCRQLNLTSLTLKYVDLNSASFNIICSMEQLEYLNFEITSIPASMLVNIEKLSNLKSLIVNEGGEDERVAIEKLNLPKVEYLGLWNFPELDDCWYKMDGMIGSIKKVRYGPCFSLGSIDSVIQAFPKLESIKIGMDDGHTENEYEPYTHVFDYDMLKQFYITTSPVYLRHLDVMPFVNICKNLEDILLYCPMQTSVLRHLLETKKKLRKLAIHVDEESSFDINSEIVDSIESNAPQLCALNLTFGTNTWNMQLDILFIKKRLIHRFPIIVYDCSDLTIKKRGETFEKWE